MEKVLICGTNWIGDTLMSMPAYQLFLRARPDAAVAVLVRPWLAPLWRLHVRPPEILTWCPGLAATWDVVRRLRRENFQTAFVLPHSFRSAFWPWAAGIPRRVGLPGHARDWMLTEVRIPPDDPARYHQVFEYVALLAPEEAGTELDPPRLRLPEEAVKAAAARTAGLKQPLVALLPGAGRGPAKRWPAEHFAEVGRRWAGEGGGVLVLGGAQDRALCCRVAEQVGPSARTVAGEADLAEAAALLAACAVAVANDSGGMHLAAAVGTPVVALFGSTDPRKTGPWGAPAEIFQTEGPRRRDVPRRSQAAAARLASISPAQVYDAVTRLARRGWVGEVGGGHDAGKNLSLRDSG